ncbi:MAG: thioredoxin-dependent thiol peroxidase [Marinilabiliales bacterium]|nr:MAG: thioredoxin-dependent thiol peroxidase [Marinilabiliales bacterium]
MKDFLKVGDQAPEFYLPDQDGKMLKLADYAGKWLVLYFYPKDNTPGCSTEGIDFTALKDKFEDNGAEVLGISADSVKSHNNFCAKKNLGITLLSDEDKKTIQDYGVWQMKKMYGREFPGIVRTTYLINPYGEVVEVWKKVKVKEHAQKVLEKLIEKKS